MQSGAGLPSAEIPKHVDPRWLVFLPSRVRVRIQGRRGLQAALGNSTWLFADKILRMVAGLLVGIWVVRYLGPTQLGLLSYAGAFAGLFGAIAALGLDSIVVRELVKDPGRRNKIMGSAFVLKLAGGLVAVLLSGIGILFARPGDSMALWIVLLIAAGFVFQSLNVIDFHFQARVQSRNTVMATASAFLIATLAKIGLLLVHAPLIAFGWVALMEIVLTSIFLVIAFRRNDGYLKDWRYDAKVAIELLKASWPLILSAFAIMIYMRIDQIMIGQMLGDTEVGFFAAAIRISELWYFVPMALASSIFPTIVESKKKGDAIYYARLQKYFSMMLWLALSVAIGVTVLRHHIVQLLYGSQYAESATVLAIHVWAGVFMVLGVASSSWLIVENLQKLSFYRTLVGGVINVLLNLLWIPKYGIEGSAMATVCAQAMACLFFDALNKKTRPIFFMKIKALNPLSIAR